MRKWSGARQLKPVPCTSITRVSLQQLQEELLVVFNRIDLGVQTREHIQRSLWLDAGHAGNCGNQFEYARSRWRRKRPPSQTRSLMLW